MRHFISFLTIALISLFYEDSTDRVLAILAGIIYFMYIIAEILEGISKKLDR